MNETYRIGFGTHDSYGEGTCLLELVDYMDRRRRGVCVDSDTKLSDAPKCVSRVIAEFGRQWNDGIGNGNEGAEADEIRTRLLLPLAPLMLDTATTADDEVTRAWLATDWLVRVAAPSFMDLAGLHEHAERLLALEPVTGAADKTHHVAVLSSARGAADAVLGAVSGGALGAADAVRRAALGAAMDAAGGAAGDAALGAAFATAKAAARAVVMDAARDATMAAARAVVRAVARGVASGMTRDMTRDIARIILAPTVAELQASAVELVKAMCAVGREKGLNQ